MYNKSKHDNSEQGIFGFIIQDVVLFSLLLNQRAYVANFGQVSFPDYTVDSLKVVCGVQLL